MVAYAYAKQNLEVQKYIQWCKKYSKIVIK